MYLSSFQLKLLMELVYDRELLLVHGGSLSSRGILTIVSQHLRRDLHEISQDLAVLCGFSFSGIRLLDLVAKVDNFTGGTPDGQLSFRMMILPVSLVTISSSNALLRFRPRLLALRQLARLVSQLFH